MRLLLCAGVQGNLTALEAVLDNPAAQAVDLIVCLGDVASGPRPRGVIARLRSVGAVTVRGNMDDVISTAYESPSASSDDPRFLEIDAWCAQRLAETERAWLAALPLTETVELGHDRRLFACHGSPRSNEDVIDASTSDGVVREVLGAEPVDVFAVGHMHVPLLRRVAERTVVHPGSVGWPAPGANGLRSLRAEFAILKATVDGVSVAFHQARYPYGDLQNDVLASDMPHAAWFLEGWQRA